LKGLERQIVTDVGGGHVRRSRYGDKTDGAASRPLHALLGASV